MLFLHSGNSSYPNQSLTACNEGWTYYVEPGGVSATMEVRLFRWIKMIFFANVQALNLNDIFCIT